MPVSVICTIKNEATALPRLLDSLVAQTRAPDEIVIVDGGSTDGTLDLLNAYTDRLRLKIISQPGANISQGRNLAIRAATGDIICSTDAGVRLEPCWGEELVKPFEMDGERRTEDRGQNASVVGRPSSVIDVVSGFFVPDPGSVYETALSATTLPVLADIQPEKFAPSSRSIAFRKSAWQTVNGYPEWLDYCEDLIFDFALRDAGFCFAFAPRAIAHFRPRENLRAFYRQYYFYARGDGKANLFFKRHLIRYGTYLIAVPLLIALTIAVPLASIPPWIIAAFAMFFTPYRRLFPMIRASSFGDRLRAIVWVPIIRITGDVAKMIGYPTGVLWRLQRKRAGS
jgi:glycosyltransferase involved in cell wall biosynthesis